MQQSDSNPISSVITDSYGPGIRLTLARTHLFGRMTHDHKPPRMHQVKSAVSIARQVARRSSCAVQEAIFFSGNLLDEVAAMSLMMPEFSRIHTAPLSLPAVIDAIMGLRNPGVLVAYGETRAPRDELTVALANVIDGLNPETRGLVLSAVLADIEKTRSDVRAGENEIIVQEKPGKFSIVRLPDENALKAAHRRVQAELANVETQRDYLAKVGAEDGWAAGGIVVEEVDTDNPRAVRLAAATFRWQGQQLSLHMPKAMAANIIRWLEQTAGISAASLAHVSTSSQSVAVAGHLALEVCAAAGCANRPQLAFPDFGSGWMPAASVLRGLIDVKVPALFIFCESFPAIEVLAVWR